MKFVIILEGWEYIIVEANTSPEALLRTAEVLKKRYGTVIKIQSVEIHKVYEEITEDD